MCDRILVFSTKPGRISSENKVNLAQTPDRLDPAIRDVVERIYVEMTTRLAATEAGRARTERFAGTGIGTVLPRVSTNVLAGLIEAVAGPPYLGKADPAGQSPARYRWRWTTFFPVGETLQMLRLAELAGGDIRLTDAGKAFAVAEVRRAQAALRPPSSGLRAACRPHPPRPRRAAEPRRAARALLR